ncbi:lipopolysaccharide-induced tumor necrosis factor-alpha factor homolog [Chironomus tepperi]|uniref:lipopolysaccharide-induced tumor necrosis factor-alpha factor homolog n=1 Tax=Chironomus tepperi TaxID=113505 RepID=UPI00391F4A24
MELKNPAMSQPPYPTQGQPPYPNQGQQQFGPPPGAMPAPTSYPQYGPPPITTQPTTVIIQSSVHLGPDPQPMTCPNCRANITTRVKDEATTKTHLFALGICLVGCSLGCCFIPYCVSSCQGQRHECPNCGQFVGMHK